MEKIGKSKMKYATTHHLTNCHCHTWRNFLLWLHVSIKKDKIFNRSVRHLESAKIKIFNIEVDFHLPPML